MVDHDSVNVVSADILHIAISLNCKEPFVVDYTDVETLAS